MQKIKLLLVEDDEDDFILTKDLLDEFMGDDYQLDWKKTVNEARKALYRNEHDLCLMDYQLGSEDGIQLLKEVSGVRFTGPIIMLTGLKDKKLDAMALKAGAVDYLVKANLTRDHLERAIRYAIARKEAQRERDERLRAESASRAKSEFLAHLSHELRTPLTAILGYSDMLYGKVSDLEDKSYLQIIHQNGKHLLGLLNDVLDLSKIEAGKLEIEKGYVDLESFFTDIYLLMNVKAEDKNLEFQVNFNGENYPSIHTDPIRLRQVLINLIGNALKFTKEGEVKVDISTEQYRFSSSEKAQECLTVCVSDTGIGIDNEKLSSIFQPFTQVSNANDSFEPGTGLGLTISRELMLRMGGNLSVESEVNKGSRFYCRLRLENQRDLDKRALKVSHTQGDFRPQFDKCYEGCVLVVDDLLDIRRLIGHIIATTGVEVIYAQNGVEAVEMLQAASENSKTIDMVLMDIQMPHMDGRTAATKMRAIGFDRPIVALTASSMKGDKEKCLEAGFSDFLGKPVETSRLYEVLDGYLERKDQRSVLQQTEQKDAGESLSVIENSTQQVLPVNEREKVLVIEDNIDACTITAMLIEQLGWEVETAYNAKEALQKVRDQALGIIFFDVNLPDMNGYSLVKEIKKVKPEIRFIALSGEDVSRDIENELGVKHHLMKPVNASMLEDVLMRAS
ncbi:Autoinducer 2 sensor kinase/phosphatase LuxQ [Thalassocella blandensis]|nr:Autoinducer 2 sensor kinase/phosphatase LuxQ [Thalassocella blandensis]